MRNVSKGVENENNKNRARNSILGSDPHISDKFRVGSCLAWRTGAWLAFRAELESRLLAPRLLPRPLWLVVGGRAELVLLLCGPYLSVPR